MQKKILYLITALVLSTFVTISSAQSPPDPGTGGDVDPPPIGGAPIDGGLISILVAAGASYFIAKGRKSKKVGETAE